MRRFQKLLGISAAFTAIALSAPDARADQKFHIISPGFLWGITKQLNDEPAWGALGAELTYAHIFEHNHRLVGVGAFAQVQTVGFHHLRGAVGPQATYSIFGVEVGPYIEAGKDTYGTTIGFQASPFITLGVFSAAFRAAIPLTTTSAGDRYGVDLGAVFTLKLPFAPSEPLGYLPIAWMALVER
jgi:hypothetical protein